MSFPEIFLCAMSNERLLKTYLQLDDNDWFSQFNRNIVLFSQIDINQES